MKVLVVHPDLRKTGGAELVALHILGWLLRHTDATITVMTLYPVDLVAQLNRLGYPDTNDRIRLLQAAIPFFVPEEGPQAMARLAWLHHAARKRAPFFDVGISTYNEIHLGIPTIQYIHHPFYVNPDLLEKHSLAPQAVIRSKRRFPHAAYDVLNRLVAGAAASRFRRNHTLTNSRFMADVITDCYGIRPTVVYPSFIRSVDETDSVTDRESRILVAGRFAPDKEIVPFLESALTLASIPVDVAGLRIDAAYSKRIHDIGAESDGRIRVWPDISDAALEELMRVNRYYVNTRRFEHFGIATLEAAAAGCLPFVHASGGSPEIVPFEELHYRQAADVFDRIRVLESDAAQRRDLGSRLRAHIRSFDLDRFHAGFGAAYLHLTETIARP
jgi:glycosyltransferase involved in cell wall biosynthesis